jgi:YtxH-like protein
MFGMKDVDLKDLRKQLRNIDKDDLLEMVGLQTRSPATDVVSVLAAFGVGMLVGAGVGLLLAPKSGREIRDDLKSRLQGASDQLSSTVSGVASTMMEKPTPARPL